MSAALQQRLAQRLKSRIDDLGTPPSVQVEGKLTRMVGLTLEAIGLPAVIGSRCLVRQPGQADVEAEVVGFSGDFMSLMPIDPVQGLGPTARVLPLRHGALAPVGPGLLGRVLDGAGRPLDGKGPIRAERHVPLAGTPQNPLGRPPIREPLDVGVRSINSLLTVGRGQRLGLFAGSGVGKSVLLGMMTRYTAADVTVVGLIGERGREVNEFVTSILGAEGLKRAVVVTAPADTTALQRLQGAMLATAIAEYFRDRGLNVLLLVDSLTRVAHAQREIALSVGEPPATKGYPPSVFARLPALIERAGTAPGGGSITAFYTVLTEGDDPNDPIADSARAILDGHILLSRDIAETGLYPAIDMESSVSRLMVELASPQQLAAARRFRQLYSTYRQNRDLVAVGAYQAGADPLLDEAIARQPQLLDFLRQDLRQGVDHATSVAGLDALFAGAGA
ncbi:FliI/YscN family ATPase [Immundisolibacter sp.]|uniref:FliI/YscN family ATPase n=1 Tax=Immundisolibacter sp. TaxID=1934948 RepID=UPI0019A71DD6|nr:FliI/YscN family ATPase [Immundisolibacter sp.]MBC7161548.1 FliI/YscN family ATPase [Immundisolibacter sp.]MEA3219271.1 Flagellum-specific ATP synthase [Immundisolibacter sp.]